MVFHASLDADKQTCGMNEDALTNDNNITYESVSSVKTMWSQCKQYMAKKEKKQLREIFRI